MSLTCASTWIVCLELVLSKKPTDSSETAFERKRLRCRKKLVKRAWALREHLLIQQRQPKRWHSPHHKPFVPPHQFCTVQTYLRHQTTAGEDLLAVPVSKSKLHQSMGLLHRRMFDAHSLDVPQLVFSHHRHSQDLVGDGGHSQGCGGPCKQSPQARTIERPGSQVLPFTDPNCYGFLGKVYSRHHFHATNERVRGGKSPHLPLKI